MSVATKIQEARERSGMSLIEVARKLGVTKSAVSNWEQGLAIPRSKRQRQLAKLLGLTLGDLVP